MSTPTHDTAGGGAAKSGTSTRHRAGLFDIRNIIGALMGIYGVVLIIMSFVTSEADKAKADGANLNLWTGLGLLALSAALIGWALVRPIVVDERELAQDRAATDHDGNAHAGH